MNLCNSIIVKFIYFTDKNACIKSALTLANGFPLTSIVNVSSFSVAIKLPNHDLFVNSGDESGVKCTSSVLVSNLRLWNLGEPRNEFLIVVKRDLQWWAPDPAPVWGDPGGVRPTNLFKNLSLV